MAKKKAVMKKTRAAKKAPAGGKNAVRTKARSKSHVPEVRVQMFRQGLGDSFLVTFDDQGPDERRMLIDCGTLGNKVTKINTASIAAYLKSLIGQGKRIDVLVATHEHQDHVSGFRKDLQPVLKGNVGQVWLAWTENPSDLDARRIAKYKGDLATALYQVSQVAPDQPVCQNVLDLLGFAGDVTLGATLAESVNDAMEFVRIGTGAKPRYCNPGDLIEDQIPGFRVYVLGPPRKDQFLNNAGSHASDELYGLAATLGRTAALHLDSSTPQIDAALPFDERYNQTGQRVREEQYPSYVDADEAWRRIDYDWLKGSSELALQLDNLTNNTSLVLAFERIADGKVLLFPADAQEGNWLGRCPGGELAIVARARDQVDRQRRVGSGPRHCRGRPARTDRLL
jgi:hypothetical protein